MTNLEIIIETIRGHFLSTLHLHDKISIKHHRHEDIVCKIRIEQEKTIRLCISKDIQEGGNQTPSIRSPPRYLQ